MLMLRRLWLFLTFHKTFKRYELGGTGRVWLHHRYRRPWHWNWHHRRDSPPELIAGKELNKRQKEKFRVSKDYKTCS